jgi:hypothetical protein
MPSCSTSVFRKQRSPKIPNSCLRATCIAGLFSNLPTCPTESAYSYRMAGRPSKLTPEVQRIIVDVLRNCGTRTVATARANLNPVTFLDWIRKGEQATSGKYYDFLMAVRDAEAQAVSMAVRTVRLKIVGGWHKVPVRDRDGNYVFKRDPMTGEILRDAQGRPDAELVDKYTEPDDARAAWYLERRDRANWGSSGEGVTVNVNPAPARRDPSDKEVLDLFEQAVQILVDNGMKLPESAIIEYQGQKAIETTAKTAETTALTLPGVESMSEKDLDNWSSHHALEAGQAEKFEAIRTAATVFAQVVCDCTSPSADQTAALRKIREAAYTANGAIAGGGK